MTFTGRLPGSSALFSVLLGALLLSTAHIATAQSKGGGKSLKPPFALDDEASLSLSMDRIISDSTNTHLYDPITLDNLTRMRDQAAPQVNDDDMNVSETQRVVEKALAIQSGKSAIDLFNKGDLRETYQAIRSSFRSIQDALRYSVQTSGSGYTVSRKGGGEKLLELNVEFNASHLLDPTVKIGKRFRVRYDREEKAPLLEFRVTF